MKSFQSYYTQLNEKWDYSQGKKITSFKFGKYQLIRPGRVGYVFPFDLSLLSKKTQENIQKLQKEYFFEFDQIIVSPVYDITSSKDERLDKIAKDRVDLIKQYSRNLTPNIKQIKDMLKDRAYQRHTVLITGHDHENKPIVYARLESGHHSAGQTKIYWNDGRPVQSATTILNNPLPLSVRIKLARKSGDINRIVDVESELF